LRQAKEQTFADSHSFILNPFSRFLFSLYSVYMQKNYTDTCGVHNLHGMPAVASALFSAIFAYFATKDAYGDSLYTIFPGMKNSTMMEDEHEMIIGVRVL
jgi:hypothetical protein